MNALFPYFGGKSAVADLIWEALGNPAHVIDPFVGSAALHLARPHPPGLETWNDADHWVVNYLRAVRVDPDAVCRWATGPVIEADLHARHCWLVENDGFRERMVTEPDYCDAQVAGWWLWGICAWIGSGWCVELHQKRMPVLAHMRSLHGLSPQCAPAAALEALAQRLARVRICYGDWTRVCTPAVLNALETQPLGIFLDPPYLKARRDKRLYAVKSDVAPAVASWARTVQDRPNTRIVLCGYAGDYDMPGWTVQTWKAQGGFGNQGQGRGRANARQECLWFSPQCAVQQLSLWQTVWHL